MLRAAESRREALGLVFAIASLAWTVGVLILPKYFELPLALFLLPVVAVFGAKLAQYPPDTLFVTYCAGPHCNGAARAAIRLARLGRPVKVMPGGITGWIDEGLALHTGSQSR